METSTIIQYAVILALLLLISFVILKLTKKDFGLEINKLVKCLGGKDNILDTEVNMSRLKVTLKDVSIVDKEGIVKLGAKGIVEIDNQLKIIFGNNSNTLKRYVDDLK